MESKSHNKKRKERTDIDKSDQMQTNPEEQIQQRKIVKVKRREQERPSGEEEGGIEYSEDEFEEEIIEERDDDLYDDEVDREDWEDVDS